MDYMYNLTSTKHRNECVFMVIEKFSKMVVLEPSKKSIIVKSTTKIFFEHVWVFYCTVCSLGKFQPKSQSCDTIGDTYHCHLNRYPPRFSEGQVPHKGGFLGDPRGIAKGEAKG
jgi:hypothetical protein